MPPKGQTKQPKRVIDWAVKRFREGERAEAIAKDLTVSKATIYGWIAADTKLKIDALRTVNMTPENMDKAEKRDVLLENKSLKAENEKLWKKVQELMLKYGEL